MGSGKLGTSEQSGATPGATKGCGSRLDGFVQLVLSTLISGFVMLLGIGILQIAPLIYDILKPLGNIQNNKTFTKIHNIIAWALTLLVEATGYLLIILSVVILIVSIFFFIKCIMGNPYYTTV